MLSSGNVACSFNKESSVFLFPLQITDCPSFRFTFSPLLFHQDGPSYNKMLKKKNIPFGEAIMGKMYLSLFQVKAKLFPIIRTTIVTAIG
jgi:hypothetical protein